MEKKSEDEVQKLFRALMIVEQNGIFLETKLSKKDKGGRLEMWEEGKNEWIGAFFALYDTVLFYYKRSKLVCQVVLQVLILNSHLKDSFF
jgi:hypothetical protein